VRNNSKKASLAAFSCPSVKAYIDYANSASEQLDYSRLYKVVELYYKASNALVVLLQRPLCF
jgi:hypothetical protein